MREFLEGEGCLMEFLRRELDDPGAQRCGRCARCLGHPLFPHSVDPDLAREAFAYLRDQWFAIEPRKQWAEGGRIPANRQAEPIRVLSVSGDGGWSRAVDEQQREGYGDDLVDALVELTRGKAPDPLPTWVTCVPSRRHPDRVPSLAARFAARVQLPFRPVVTHTRDTVPQRDMDNSAQQCANVKGAFEIPGDIPGGPVYLIDDTVDSRWTFTVVAALLRETGAGPVFPLALAQTRSN
jgi:ATP-dependent DNA helicase RecQ